MEKTMKRGCVNIYLRKVGNDINFMYANDALAGIVHKNADGSARWSYRKPDYEFSEEREEAFASFAECEVRRHIINMFDSMGINVHFVEL